MPPSNFIRWFSEITMKDLLEVGGKNASLGEMYHYLVPKGIRVPNGFTVTVSGWQYFLEETGLKKGISKVLKRLELKNIRSLRRVGKEIREMILRSALPNELQTVILRAYEKFPSSHRQRVAVRSSATAEDLPSASFAGQQESYLNIQGNSELLGAVKKCFASLFTDRAISYRADQGFGQLEVELSVGIQEMVNAGFGSSGVMFTLDTESGFRDIILINSIYGLGENIVQGKVMPDEFLVFKPTLRQGFKAIIKKKISRKEKRLVYRKGGTKSASLSAIINQPVPKNIRLKASISDKEVLELARWAMLIEDHYQTPMDIEWAKEGQTGKLYILQARPETVHSPKNIPVIEEYKISAKPLVLLEGLSIGSKIGQGKVRIINEVRQITQFRKEEVLVTTATNPDWEPIMKMANAIITEKGGRTSHAAIVSRELGIPAVVGASRATQILKNGQKVTVDCSQGEKGYIYQGLIPFKIKKINLKSLKKPQTQIMLNMGEPETAFHHSFLPHQGVGLARMEFILNDYIKVHPLALVHYPNIKNQISNIKNKLQIQSPDSDRRTKFKTITHQIEKITVGYKDKKEYFVDKLASGIAQIAAAFFPKPVIVRFSDFKSNEYAHLIGGQFFEPKEENPMIGWRGASRYYDPLFKPAFELEIETIKKVRDDWGLRNVDVMVPFCRTIEEGKRVLAILKEKRLLKDKNPKVYVMIEIPSNVILAKEFAKLFDGFSIGSNDLTQLVLGVDRDSQLISHIYDERNEAVKTMITQLIKTAKKNKIKVGICGQAPSDFPDFVEFLVKEGIDSISLNPDSLVKTTLKVLAAEKRK